MLRRAFLSLFVLFALTAHAWAVCGAGASNCYWIGGTGNTNDAAHWASVSGGVAGALTPAATDQVNFDSSSGTGTVTLAANLVVDSVFSSTASSSLIMAMGTRTLTISTSSTITGMGASTCGAGGRWIANASLTLTVPTSTERCALEVTAGTTTFSGQPSMSGAGLNASIEVSGGTLTATSSGVKASTFAMSSGTTNMSTGTWQMSGLSWSVTGGTISASTSTMSFTNTSASTLTFAGGGKTYSTVSFARTGSAGNTTLTGTNTFTTFNVTAGSGNIILPTGTVVTGNMNFTGFTGDWSAAGGTLTLGGNLTLGTGMTVGVDTDDITFNSTSGTKTVTTNGVVMNKHMTFNGVGGTWQLQDALVMSGATGATITLTNGTLDFNNFNVTTGIFSSNNSNTRTLLMGSGTIELIGAGTVWSMATSTGMTLTPSTSTIKTTNSTVGTKNFNGGGKTYNNIWSAQGSTGIFQIGDSNNIFNDFKVTNPPRTVQFIAGTTTTVTTWTVAGTAGNLITIQTESAGSAATVSDSSGTNTCDYCSIKDNTPAGGATWNALTGSSCVSNCTGTNGWNFGGGATPSRLMLIGVGGTLEERYRPANDNDVTLRNAA